MAKQGAAPPQRAFRSASDLPRERVYGPGHPADPATALGEPGHYPFTRGLHESGYRGRWLRTAAAILPRH